MKGFLEQYGVAIFTLVIIAILIAFAGPIGIIIKKATNDQIKNVDKIGTEEIDKTKGGGTDAYEAVDAEKSWTESHTDSYFFERISSDQTNADYNKWKSNNNDVDDTSAVSTFTIDAPKDMEYSFDWTVSSESNYDKLTITCNGTTIVNGVSGTKTGIQKVSLKLGTNTLIATYLKDTSGSNGDDCATITLPNIKVSVCKNNQTGEISNHIYDKGKITKEPTCTENSEKIFTCKNCGHTKTEVVEKLGHKFVNEVCTRCGYDISKISAVDQVYCIYYSDGEMTISQNEIEPEAGRTVVKKGFYASPSSCTTAMTTVQFIGTVKPKSCVSWFINCSSLTEIKNIENLCTSECTDMSEMFKSCQSLISLDVSHFDTKKVTNMCSMFQSCKLTNLDVSNFDTRNVTDMTRMFYYCDKLINLDVSKFKTSNVTNMLGMFTDCEQLQKLDVSHFDTSNVTNMTYMFERCVRLTKLDLSGWNIENVTRLTDMFYGCKQLKYITATRSVERKIISSNYPPSVRWTIID